MNYLILERTDLCQSAQSIPMEEVTLNYFAVPEDLIRKADVVWFAEVAGYRILKNRYGQMT